MFWINYGISNTLTGAKQLSASFNPDLEITAVQHTFPTTFSEAYTYDPRGNRLASLANTFSYNDLNQLLESATHTYTYDADGNLVQERNKASGETKKYFYNSENRLTGYEHYANEFTSVDQIAQYTYDLYGRRIQKTVNGMVTNFLWDEDNISLEYTDNNQPIRRYVYGVGMDNVEGHFEYAEATSNPFATDKKGWYTYIKDQVGTVYKTFSHGTSQVVNSRAYDTFGNLISQSGTLKGNLGFQSKYLDPESGLYYFYHRYYSPSLGRFTTEDPIELKGGLNVYKFEKNNSLNFIDPYGLVTGGLTIIDIPTDQQTLINMGGSYTSGGVTVPSMSLYPSSCECLKNDKWYPRFHFSLELKVYYTTGKKHEYRHVNDMHSGYSEIFNLLFSSETNYEQGFSSENECIMYALELRDFALSYMETINNESILFRDTVPIWELPYVFEDF